MYASSAPKWPLQPVQAIQHFDAKSWCDDHNLFEPEIGTRLAEANVALCSAIIDVLGPGAVNEEKFKSWFKQGKALELLWDIPHASLAMPKEKLEKALSRVNSMLISRTTSTTQLNQLLGSLRHIATCVRAGAPFYQRLSALAYSRKRYAKIPVSTAARDDLHWFRMILCAASSNSIPLARFVKSQPVDFDIYVDASDYGLCSLFPQRHEYIKVKFD